MEECKEQISHFVGKIEKYKEQISHFVGKIEKYKKIGKSLHG